MKINTNNVSLKISAGKISQLIHAPIPQIVFSGRSNVGKSSLINSLLNRKNLARVSSEPGKTITINFYNVDEKIYLVDLPGYGYAKRTNSDKMIWSNLVNGFFTQNENIDLVKLVIQLVDSRIGYTNDDLDMISFLNETDLPYIIVATKVDKLNKTQREESVTKLISNKILKQGTPIVLFSSQTKEGKDDIWREIFNHTDK